MQGSPGAVRISLLVCAGVASGYLWRAAFEAPAGAISQAVTPGLPLARPVPAQVTPRAASHHAKAHARKAAARAAHVRQLRHAARARAQLASAEGGSGRG